MPSDSYKIEVLHYLSPHLIWIEVSDPSVLKDEFVFEQVGIYGVLPLEKTLDIETEDMVIQKCDDWLPAAAAIMSSFLDNSTEVWFSPTHIDRRTSIFDDNIHKYGEITIKTENGKLKKLSKYLVKSGFAYVNVCDFHERLSCGKLKTKLSTDKTHEVIKELEKFYIKKDKSKKNWKKSVDKQTSVFQMSQNLESLLTVSNIEKHNNQMIKKTLCDKLKDFELCKDIDEESLGRGYEKATVVSTEDSNSHLLKRKLSMAKVKEMKYEDFNKTYDSIRSFLDANSSVIEDSVLSAESRCISGDASSEVDGVKKENRESFLSRKLKHCKKFEKTKLHKDIDLESGVGDSKSVQIDTAKDCTFLEMEAVDDNGFNTENLVAYEISQEYTEIRTSDPTSAFTPKSLMIPSEMDEKNVHTTSKQKCVSTPNPQNSQKGKPTNKFPEAKNLKQIQVAYGPPGLDPRKFKIEVMTLDDYDDDPKIDFKGEVDVENHDCMLGDVDSEVDIEMTSKRILNEYFKNTDTVDDKSEEIEQKCIKPLGTSEHEGNLSDVSIERKSFSSGSLFLQRKLKTNQNSSMKHDSSVSSTGTSNKDSSTDETKKSDDEEDIEEVMEKLNIKYNDEQTKRADEPINDFSNTTKLKNNVNPFKNIDPNISVFVDKLVTPILMVHCKHDRRIQPVFDMRDVYFNTHIHNILKNMSIDHPMMLQTVSWYTILRGYSLFTVSPLGSGKTLGYLPAVCRLVSDSKSISAESVGPVCIVVSATAKSVTNVERMAKMFLESEGRVLACYAGVDNLHITATLLNGCDLLISTPSSLVRLLQATDFPVDLRRLSTFVLDDCERLSQVYGDEIKYFLYKVKEMLKLRANKELKVQYILASRVWCDFMEPLARKVPDTVICIGAFQECVLYSKTNTSVCFVKSENKIDYVFEFLKEINSSKKTVIVCQTDDEVRLLEKALKRSKHVLFACDNNMTIHDLYNLSVSWADFKEPLIAPILICCDSNLTHMNITDAHNLIHYSLPSLFSMFCKRFSVLNDNYPSIFKSDNEVVKIKILLEEGNVEQLPKILNFIRRCTDNIPSFLDDICNNILAEKDVIKAKNLHPLCDSLLTLGYCPDFYNCKERHTILKEYDTPKDWLPTEGVITCKILHYHSATLYSARLLTCTVNGTTTTYPQTHSILSLKMGMYYSKDSNRKLHGIPEVGDICATAIKLNFYTRCQVLKVLSKYQRGNPNKVLVKLIDEERLEVTRDIYLYHLPEILKEIESRTVHVRLGNLEPKDKDITFSDLARNAIGNFTDNDAELFFKGNITLTVGNCIFVNTLEACQELISLNEVVVKCNLKSKLLESHALPNPGHLTKLEKSCIDSGLFVRKKKQQQESKVPIKNLPRGTWAHLDSDNLSCVYCAHAITPDKFFVRHDKFESCMSSLLQDIRKYIDTNPTGCGNVKEGELVLAKFPDDSTYERARIDGIREYNAKCFFVDQGDWREVPLNDLLPITEQFINQLPFQAIECRLIGIQPAGDQWTDFSTYWFCDNCYTADGDLKHLFVKYFKKEPAEFTNGHKYSVALIDTSTEQDVVINQLMIDLNLAQENEIEIKYLNNVVTNTNRDKENFSPELEDDDWEAISVTSIECSKHDQENTVEQPMPQSNILLTPPIRSVPVVNSDNESDDSDKWDVNIDDSYLDFFPGLKVLKDLKESTSKMNTIATPEAHDEPERKINRAEIIELDSDDLTSPDTTLVSASPEKPKLNEIAQSRRPKLVWRQNKNIITVKIQLIGVENYKLDIGERVLNFDANVNETQYTFEIELYGIIDNVKSTHVNKGQYILVKLFKVLNKNWLTLTKDGGFKKWIVYDVDNIDASSDEEVVDDSHVKNIVRNIHNSVESESDDDDFIDDANSTYKKYDQSSTVNGLMFDYNLI